jgi:hypothetical protein
MRPSLRHALLLIVLLATAASGCSDSTTTTPTPTPTPTPVAVTETFAGGLTTGGAAYHLLTAKVGEVVMTMKGIGPDPAVTIGM